MTIEENSTKTENFDRKYTNNATLIGDVKSTIQRLESMTQSQIQPIVKQGYVEPKPVWATRVLINGLLCRLIKLTKGSLLCLESDNKLAAMILARSIIEDFACLNSLHAELENCLEHNDLQKFWLLIKNFTFGMRPSIDPEIPNPQILNHIDRGINEDNNEKELRELYDSISNIAHPNYAGVCGGLGELDQTNIIWLFDGDVHPDLFEYYYCAIMLVNFAEKRVNNINAMLPKLEDMWCSYYNNN
jgi:hypothetical protein